MLGTDFHGSASTEDVSDGGVKRFPIQVRAGPVRSDGARRQAGAERLACGRRTLGNGCPPLQNVIRNGQLVEVRQPLKSCYLSVGADKIEITEFDEVPPRNRGRAVQPWATLHRQPRSPMGPARSRRHCDRNRC